MPPQQRQVPQHRREPHGGLGVVHVHVEHPRADALVLQQAARARVVGEELAGDAEDAHRLARLRRERGARQSLGERGDAALVDLLVPGEEPLKRAHAQRAAISLVVRSPRRASSRARARAFTHGGGPSSAARRGLTQHGVQLPVKLARVHVERLAVAAQDLARGEEHPRLLVHAEGLPRQELSEHLHQVRHEGHADEVRELAQADERRRHQRGPLRRRDARRVLEHAEVHLERRLEHARLQLALLRVVHAPRALVHVASQRLLQVVLVAVAVGVVPEALEALLVSLLSLLLGAPFADHLSLLGALLARLFSRKHLGVGERWGGEIYRTRRRLCML